MITTYQQALDYLYSFIAGERQTPRPPPELNLTRTAALLSAMGEPQRAFPSVIVAGTKGKGSTCAMIEAMARESGLRVGLWTSPHLHSYRERIQVHRRLIAQGELVRLVELARPHVDDVTRATGGAPVTFAIGFAVAMRYFAEVGVDLAVLEVGLGGRYDSANVVAPILSVITSISYDHLDILGDTLTQIAWQKAGVMKRGVPTATLRQDPEAMRVLEAYAAEVGAELHVVRDEADRQPSATDRQGMVPAGGAGVAEPHGDTAVDLASLHLGLAGSYQRDNALLSLGAARLLRRSLALTDAGIASGLANVRWPGRMEVVGGEPPVVVDGAHNGDSARRLLESLGELFPGRRLVLVFGTSRDKDLSRILPTLMPAAGALVLTHSPHPRSLADLHQLRAQITPLLAPGTPVAEHNDVSEAIEVARTLAEPGDVICVTGSLFIVAAAREALGLPHEKD